MARRAPGEGTIEKRQIAGQTKYRGRVTWNRQTIIGPWTVKRSIALPLLWEKIKAIENAERQKEQTPPQSLLISAADALLDLHTLVATINATKPSTKIYVATLPPLANAAKNLNVIQFNTDLGPALLGTNYKLGPDVYSVVNGRLVDSWHPTEAALHDVGEAWIQKLAKEFPQLGGGN